MKLRAQGRKSGNLCPWQTNGFARLTGAESPPKSSSGVSAGRGCGVGLHNDGADLLLRVIREYPDDFEVRFAHELLGNVYREQGRLHDAEVEYRCVLVLAPDLNGTSGAVHVALGEVLLLEDAAQHAAEIQSLLESARPHLTFNSEVFRWLVLQATTADVCGDVDRRREAARAALELIGSEPQFNRHPTVGLVDPPPETIAELDRLASVEPSPAADDQ